MFSVKLLDSGARCAVRQLINRSVPLANGDDLFLGNLGEDFPESPDPALVGRSKRRTTIAPEPFQRNRTQATGTSILPAGKNDFEQVATVLATKAVRQCNLTAAYAAE